MVELRWLDVVVVVASDLSLPRAMWSSAWASSPADSGADPDIVVRSESHGFSIRARGRPDYHSRDVSLVSRTLIGHLETFAAERSATHTFLHAAVVGRGDRALLLPGRSGSGKTHLTAGMTKEPGFTYLSDERAPFDDLLQVAPAARPLAFKDSIGGIELKEPAELGCVVESRPLAIGAILLHRYRRGTRLSPARLGRGRAVQELLSHCNSPRTERTMDRIARLCEEVPVFESDRDSALELCSWVTELW